MTRSSKLTIALAALLGAAAVQAQEHIHVGFMSPITGPQAANGADNRDGALLAVKELNAKGIKVGGKPVVFDLEVSDDTADPRQGVAAAQTFADKKVRFLVGPYNSGVAMPASKLLNDAGILTLSVASNPKLTEQGYANLFRIGASDNQLGAKMATYASQELKLKTVAVIDDRTAYGQGVANEFAKEARRLGMTIVSTDYTTDKATDFAAILTHIRGSKAQAIFYGGYSSQAGPLLRQARSLAVTVPLLGGDAICSTETAKLSQLTDNINTFCTQGGSLLGKSDKGAKFVDAYRAAYKRDPLTYAAAFYDGMNMLAGAIQATQSTDPKKVADYIAKGSFAGVAGDYAYDQKHDLRSSAVTVFTFKGPDLVALKSL